MKMKYFKIAGENIVRLIPPMGGAIATDKIVVEGMGVGYMYREAGFNDLDSGWRFFSGTEDQEYINEVSNRGIYDVNTIANYDPAIIPYLDMPIGTMLERDFDTDQFEIIED